MHEAAAVVPPPNWTDERLERARWLYEHEGYSASQIATELGGFDHCRDGGRNSVIGVIHRNGWEAARRASGPRKPRKPKLTRPKDGVESFLLARIAKAMKQKAKSNAAPTPAPDPRLAFDAALEPEADAESIENIIPLGQRCTLMELNDDTCRWPIGDPGTPEFFFCGGKTGTGIPYCGYHARIAYQPSSWTPKSGQHYYYAGHGKKLPQV